VMKGKERNPIAEARKASLMTQEDLARRLGCTAANVSIVERDFGRMTLEQLSGWYGYMSDAGKQIIREYVDNFFVG